MKIVRVTLTESIQNSLSVRFFTFGYEAIEDDVVGAVVGEYGGGDRTVDHRLRVSCGRRRGRELLGTVAIVGVVVVVIVVV